MDIEHIKLLRNELERDMLALIQKFEQTTGINLRCINMETVNTMGVRGRVVFKVTVDVTLP